MLVMLFLFHSPDFLRRPSTDRRETLPHDRKLWGLDKLSPKIRGGGHSPQKWGAKSMQNFGRFSTISDFDREYLRNGSPCRKSENSIINYNPFHVGPKKFGELWSTNNRVKVAHIDQPPRSMCHRLKCGHLSASIISYSGRRCR